MGRPPQHGTTRQSVGCGGSRCAPTPAQLAALPTSTAGLAKSIARQDLGGCTGSPGCRTADIVSYLLEPVSAGTRAAAFDLLASAPGISVLGRRTVDGARGLAVRNRYGGEGMNLIEVDVFDLRDGSLLAQEQYSTSAYYADEGTLPVPVGSLIYRNHRLG